jgi:hypothetical protein
MAIDIVVNELSMQTPASDQNIARAIMSEFVQTLRQAQSEGIRGKLSTASDFHATLLAPDYYLVQWLNDRQVNRDERSFLLQRATSTPFLQDRPETASEALTYEFRFGADRAEGCGIAYLLDGLAVSLRSKPCWEASRLEIIVQQMDSEGNIAEDMVQITHACCPDHVQENRPWIQNRIRTNITDGNDMWQRRSELFPSLTFCDSVGAQMIALDHGIPMLQPVASKLFDLEMFCSGWTAGPFMREAIPGNVSPESAQTLERFGGERTFLCPDGEKRLFSWHLKINTPPWRIHFRFDNASPGRLLIGYIGRHLPTVNDPT